MADKPSSIRVAGASLALVALLAADGRADDTDACLAAYERSQELRKEGKFRASREKLVECLRASCPSLVKKDCSRWVAELEPATPTVIVNARDAQGKDLIAVRVLVDGALLVERLDGRPHEVDPGEHVFRYEGEGAEPIEEKVVVQVGEKNRVLTARFAAPTSPSSEAPAKAPEPSRPPTAAYALLSVGVAGGAAFGILAALGKHDLDEMRKSPGGCAPHCDPAEVDAARVKIVAADVSAGVGLFAAGLGAYLLLAPRRAVSSVAVGASPVHGGAMTTLAYRF
jgi:hypothetical protein